MQLTLIQRSNAADGGRVRRSAGGRTVLRVAATVLAAGVALAIPAATASASGPSAQPASAQQAATAADPGTYEAVLKPVTANKVTGTGDTWVTLKGNQALVQLQVSGLVDAVHAAHIYIGAAGTCPTDAQAHPHNGQQSITIADAAAGYGMIGTSLTVAGDSSPASALAVNRFPSGVTYTYTRTLTLPAKVVAAIRGGTAVLVVHGVDFNGNGRYDSVLGASELDPKLPAEATDPALCGTFVAAQMVTIPAGPAQTGGGSAAAGPAGSAIVMTWTGLGLLAAAGGVVVIARRRAS